MRITFHALSDVGSKRINNEDAFSARADLGLYIVADGMGGHSSGEIASAMAVEEIVKFLGHVPADEESTWPYPYDDTLSFSANRVKTAIAISNEKIHAYAAQHPESRGMGTTVVAALLERDALVIGYVGDSRAYLLRDGQISLLTQDHSWVNEQVRLGHLTEEEASRHPFRNVITKALGTKGDAQADVREVPLVPGDRLLLCTDGLNSMVSDSEIEAVLAQGSELKDVCGRLVALANRAGGEDNITVIALQCTT